MNNPIIIYNIAKNFRKATVWCADSATNKLQCTSTCTPNKHLKVRERAAEINTWLKEYFDITP